MNELKKIQLNNKSLEEFDKLMSLHLNQIEELEIDEININPKLYNLISLCTNLKQFVIKGDSRTDVNKILFNICKHENIETLILDSVKLPTSKILSKFSNLSTISLNNINFSDLIGFFNRIPNPEKIVALNLTNVDFGKRSISSCSIFKNLKYLNLDNLKNCKFDSLDFLSENGKIDRFEFYNTEINFENINSLIKGKYNKKINVDIQSSKKCNVLNSFEIDDDKVSLTINSCDLEKAVEIVSMYKLTNLFIILNNNAELSKYIKKFKKSKVKITLAINDIAYLNAEDAQKFQDRLNVQFVNIIESTQKIKITDETQCYKIDEYIKIRKEFEKIQTEDIKTEENEIDKFNKIYNYFKNNVKYVNEETNLKDVFINKKSSYDYYAIAINSLLKELGFTSKIIKGIICEEKNHFWNQIKLNGDWYNFDLAYELKAKRNKKFLKYMFKSNLLNDEQFCKTHTPYLEYKPEICDVEFQKEQKENKIGFWKKISQKIISIVKFNKEKALPAPSKNEK